MALRPRDFKFRGDAFIEICTLFSLAITFIGAGGKISRTGFFDFRGSALKQTVLIFGLTLEMVI